MNTLRQRARSTRRVLTSAGLAVLVTLSLATVALASSGSAATAAGRTDVFMRDQVGDVGIEPNTSTLPFYESPDIVVCNSAIPCLTDQTPTPGGTSYAFITLHNPGPYGSGVSNGTLYAYFTTLGGAANWPTDWTQFGAVAVPMGPGTTQVTVPWVGVPTVPGLHFCILARWVSGTDPMVFEGTNSQLNATTNNNIAWHNITSAHIIFGGVGTTLPFAIGNVTTARAINDLVITEPAGHFEGIGGTLVVDLGNLFPAWQQGGGKGTGIRPIGGTKLQITNLANARISGLPVEPGTKPQISLTFAGGQPSTATFPVVVDQQGPAVKGGPLTDLGGAEYDVSVGSGQ